MKKDQGYILQVSQSAQQRLHIQHGLYEKASQSLLLDAGLKQGMDVLEVGCGIGSMTTFLAKQVMRSGKVTAIDLSVEQIEAAKLAIQKAYQNNVTFHELDIYQLGTLNQTFDLLYCRMVLHHLNDARKGIEQMIACLKPGGILVVEEPSVMQGAFCHPRAEAVEKMKELVRKVFQAAEKQYEIGCVMANIMVELGLSVIRQSLFQPLLIQKDERLLYTMGLKELSPQIIQHGLATQGELDALCDQLKVIAETDAYMSWIRMHQCVAVF